MQARTGVVGIKACQLVACGKGELFGDGKHRISFGERVVQQSAPCSDEHADRGSRLRGNDLRSFLQRKPFVMTASAGIHGRT